MTAVDYQFYSGLFCWHLNFVASALEVLGKQELYGKLGFDLALATSLRDPERIASTAAATDRERSSKPPLLSVAR